MKNKRINKDLLSVLAVFSVILAALYAAWVAGPVFATPGEKVTICHAAGQDGTTHFVELTLAYPAAFGPAGHFYERGTPRAGHEDDRLGPCQVPTTTTEAPEVTTTTEAPEVTTTTEAPELPTTTLGEAPTTTVTVPETAIDIPKMPDPVPVVHNPSFTG